MLHSRALIRKTWIITRASISKLEIISFKYKTHSITLFTPVPGGLTLTNAGAPSRAIDILQSSTPIRQPVFTIKLRSGIGGSTNTTCTKYARYDFGTSTLWAALLSRSDTNETLVWFKLDTSTNPMQIPQYWMEMRGGISTTGLFDGDKAVAEWIKMYMDLREGERGEV